MKTETKHTPGPWTYDDTWALIMSGRKEIAACHSAQDGDRDRRNNKAECIANARLIAAAPELLEALNGLMDALRPGNGTLKDEVVPAYDKARVVLANLKET